MSRTAVLLMDLQVDFLDSRRGRMPVGDEGAARVLAASHLVLSGKVLPGSKLVVIVNAFPRSRVLSNLVRRHAAVAGSPGADVDSRVHLPPGTPIFPKSKGNAFSNPDLHAYLQSEDISRIVLVGVFAEGCIRATAQGARALGYSVVAPLDAIATDARWKFSIARYLLRRAGVALPSHLSEETLVV